MTYRTEQKCVTKRCYRVTIVFIVFLISMEYTQIKPVTVAARSKVGRTPACVKTCNSQDTISATWRKKGAQLKRMSLRKPPLTGMSHDADQSRMKQDCVFCLMSWCMSWCSLLVPVLTVSSLADFLIFLSTLKIEAIRSSEILVNTTSTLTQLVCDRPKTRTVFARWNAGIVVSNPT
jgi:hypothetical protein